MDFYKNKGIGPKDFDKQGGSVIIFGEDRHTVSFFKNCCGQDSLGAANANTSTREHKFHGIKNEKSEDWLCRWKIIVPASNPNFDKGTIE